MSKSNDLSNFLATYGPSFARTAYLLTGDADKARELATAALVSACRRWSTIRYQRPTDAVLRELYKRFLGAKGAPWTAPDGYLLAGLSPKSRAALVSTLHDGLPLPRAATITGLWVAVLNTELHRAHTHLRSTHPHLFTPHPASSGPAPAEDARGAAPRPAQGAGAGDAPGPEPEDTPAPPHAQAPGTDAGVARAPGGTTSGASPWTLSTPDTSPQGGTAAPAPAPWTLGGAAAGASPWTLGAPGEEAVAGFPGQAVAPGGDSGLRDVLVGVAGEMPYTDLAEAVLGRVATRRRVRTSVWTFTSVGLVGALVAMIAVGVSAVADNLDEAMARRTPSPFAPGTEGPGSEIPAPLPAALPDPVGYAYQGYCRDNDVNVRDPQPCGQWVLTTRTGTEWRLPDARAGYDTATGAYMQLAMSQDGHRLVYQNAQGWYLVHDLPTGLVKRIDLEAEDGEAHIGSSPDGRYFSLSFGDAKNSAVLDFQTGTTRTVRGAAVEILAVHDDGTQVVSERRDVTNVPGHATVSTLRLLRGGAAARRYRIDPALVEHGAALAPDGRSLAMVTADDRLVTMDARTGRIAARRTTLDTDDLEVVKVERWLNRDEVLVRLWDYEDVFLTRVNVRTGEVTDFEDDATDWIDYSDPLGALPE